MKNLISLQDFLKLNINDLTNKVIAFPTDTVYGIGCLVKDKIAYQRIYDIKKRDINKELPVLISSFTQIEDEIIITSDKVYSLIKMWPGALTIIFPLKETNTFNKKTLAFRIPNSKVALSIINKFGPLYTTSLNESGFNPLDDIDEISEKFPQIDYIITDIENHSQVSSTIIDATNRQLPIIRQGDIDIRKVNS